MMLHELLNRSKGRTHVLASWNQAFRVLLSQLEFT